MKWIDVYNSGYHHPLVSYLVTLVFVLAFARRLPFLYGYVVVFAVEILADATATGAFSPIALDTPAYTISSVVFIVLGDFRYFFLAERVTDPDAPVGRPLFWAACVSLIVPVVTGVMTRTLPIDTRELYMIYETALGIIVLALYHLRFAKRSPSPEITRYVRRVSALFATLYFGWAACDVLIYTGVPLGHVLRIVPNVLYYGAFVPFVYYAAPDSLKTLEAPRAVA